MSHATKEQISILTKYMEEHPELARSYNALSATARTSQKQKWEQLCRSLNMNGPPTKSVAEWKRIWTLRKYTAKKKLTDNKNSLKKTGGGPFDLKEIDATEESIIAACGMEASVSGIVGGLSFGIEKKEHNADPMIEQILIDLTNSSNQEKECKQQNVSTSKKLKNAKNNEDDALKKQIDLQENFFKNLLEVQNKTNNILAEIRDAIRQLSDTKK